jgi:multicomponent Na+:H+ antiporter subunit A
MRSLILEAGTRAVFHTMLLFSVYLLFAGHNFPGGGFIGGLVAAAAFVLYYIAEGPGHLRKTTRRVRPEVLLGVGILLAAAVGVAALAGGAAFLESGVIEVEVPIIGHVEASSVLVFDLGVYTIVVGLVLVILESLGAEMPS